MLLNACRTGSTPSFPHSTNQVLLIIGVLVALTSSSPNSFLFLMHAKLVVPNFGGTKERESGIILSAFLSLTETREY